MTRKKSHPPVNVVLWGRVAAHGRRLLQEHLNTPCRFFGFPTLAKDGSLPPALDRADVVVASAFSEAMAVAAPRLKLLHAPGAGVDGFSMKALGPKTTVANAYFHGPAIGEYVMMAILALSRDLLKMDAHFRRGTWHGSWIWGTAPPPEIHGKTLGLVGYGHIGKEVADRARAFGMKIWVVSAHPPAQKPRNIDFYEGPGNLHKLLKAADYLVLACPLNEATQGVMGKREFSSMKRSAYLINVARGPVVQEEALYHALSTRRIQGAAIDVWYQYPTEDRPFAPSRFPFNELDNIIMTPHVSGWMRGTQENRFQLIAENINRLAAGQQLVNVIQGPKRHKRH
jgi:phosphoglycerate dehydrogenase-like enzyme